ncbi:MAG: hypothetical protein CMG16_00170 [Candidatus Marinimicrobia bacterium]|nr:hypothetical protein [Candidatus Neomarinimicrobiota bacterium]
MKKKSLLIDGDLMMDFLKNGTNYLNDGKKRSMFLSFDKIFKSVTKGFFFNTESIYEFVKNRDNPQYLSQFNSVYIKRMQEIVAQTNENWQKLDDINDKNWTAIFTNENKKNRTKYRNVRDLASIRMNHYISSENIFDDKSDFSNAIDYDNINTSIKKGQDYTYKQIFRGFHHPSPYYICYDQYLFQSYNSFLSGKKFNLALLKYVSLYCNWAFECSLDKDNLPYVFFGGYSFLGSGNKVQKDFKLKIKQFLSFLNQQEKHKNIDVVNRFIDQNKLHFFDLNLEDFKKFGKSKYERLTHNNYAIVDYGGLRWTERMNLFVKLQGPIFYKEKIDKKGNKTTKHYTSYRSYKDDTIIYKTLFKDNIYRLEYQEKNLIELIDKSTGIKIRKDGSIRINTN